MSAPLNLARRPFRNERLPTLVLSLACLGLAAFSVRHALVARDLMPGRARDVESQVVALEKEIADLRAQSAELGRLAASAEALKEWAAVKALVDRRAFSWPGLFAALERAVPPGVKLVAISPQDSNGRMELSIAATGRTDADALALLQALQSDPDFEGAFLGGWTEGREGVDITSTVRYVPKAAARGPL